MSAEVWHELEVRDAERDDARALAKLMVRGNGTYREWAPRFWQPPGFDRTHSQWHLRLREGDRWTRVAIDTYRNLVALASWRPAREHGDEGISLPGVAYLSHLYVEPSRWGEGIADGLLELAEKAMREAEFARALLWTPAAAPARGFYEHCGWTLDGRERWSTELHLPMVGYEKQL
jgi:GNAT superfamily N-acetyltransferase